MNDVINSAIAQLGLNIGANVVWDVAKQYLNLTSNPTRQGMVQVLANNFGSTISTDQAVFLAEKILEVKSSNGAQIKLGEGLYNGGGSSIAIGK